MEPKTELAGVTFEIPPFASRCVAAAGSAWEASFEHSFVDSLIDGTLDTERFRFYQMQDARYLMAYADACSIISTRIPDATDKLWFIEAARLAIVVESQLHAGYGEMLGYTPEDVARLTLTPNNRAYQNHMIACATRGTVVEGIAALVPCAWLYARLGEHIARMLDPIPDEHPYADWLRTYADPGFITYTNDLLERLERYAMAADDLARERAKEAFATSTRYEWMFWQQAWELQRWPV